MSNTEKKMKYIGTIVNTKGYEGKMVLRYLAKESITIKELSPVYIGFSESFSRQYTLTTWRNSKRQALLTLTEITSDKEAKLLKEKGLFVDPKYLVNQEKFVYDPDEIIGYKAIDTKSGSTLGFITDVWILPGNDVWVVESEEIKLPIPVIDDVVLEVNDEKKEIRINLIDGLNEIKNNKTRKSRKIGPTDSSQD